MVSNKKQISGKQPEQPEHLEFLGLQLEVEHPEKGKFKLCLSQPVALILAPGLLVLTIAGGGLWLWHTLKSPGASALPPAETVQPQK